MFMNDDLSRIESALMIARKTVDKYTSGRIQAMKKSGGDPVTEADIELDKVLREILVEDGDGWLSEETVDDLSRLDKRRVWIVDPIDGTREFVEGIDEWCISVGLAIDGKMVAGGILNPARDELFLGTMETGVTLKGKPVSVTGKSELEGATVLASRSEVKRGEWDRFMDGPLKVIPMGSVAYKLARVAAGLDDATFTLVPKNEWDYAAGVMLVDAAGGKTIRKDGHRFVFNHPKPLVGGLVASGKQIFGQLKASLGITVAKNKRTTLASPEKRCFVDNVRLDLANPKTKNE